MKRALIDINILLDVLAKREPFLSHAATIWSAAERGQIQGLVSADSFSTTYYLLRRAANHQVAMHAMRLIRKVFEIVPLSVAVIEQAIASSMGDFEDAIQYHSALHGKAQCIVTRDQQHFRNTAIPVLTPQAFIATINTL